MASRPIRSALFSLLALAFFCALPAVAQDSADEAEVQSNMAIASRLLGKTPDRPAILFFLAASHAQLQELTASLANLRECIAAKEGFDPQGEPAFAVLHDSREYKQLVEDAHKDFPVVAQARVAFETQDKDLIPEGLAFDASRDAFLMSSLYLRKIVEFPKPGPARGKTSGFSATPGAPFLPILGIRLDPADNSVWAASSSDEGKSELLHFAPDGSLLGRFSPSSPGKHAFNDLVVLRDGDIYLSDTLGNQVLRFDRKTSSFSSLTLARELLFPNGVAISADESTLFFADQFGLFRFDPSSGNSVELDPGPRNTLSGIDGLYWRDSKLIAIQNGIGSPRVAQFTLSRDATRVSRVDILEYRTSLTALPTTGALVAGDFYFISNSQLDNLNRGHILDLTRLAPVRIARVHLP